MNDDLYYDTSTGTRVLRRQMAFSAARIKFEGNVLHSASCRTLAENVAICFQALSLLTGLSVEELEHNTEGITIEAYRSS